MHDMPQRRGRAPRRYLKSLHMDAFGRFSNHDIGPLSPGLNVIYGENESGKTSMAKFIEGVLFGWEASRKNKNSYRPKNGAQSGALIFARCDDDQDIVALSRARSADGLRQTAPAKIVDGVDASSFKNVFSIDGDALRKVESPEDMLDRLLTAESGSEASPVAISNEIEKRMKSCFSKSASNPDSISNLKQELSQVRNDIAIAESKNGHLIDQDRELRALEEGLPALKQAIDRSNERVERFVRAHDALERLEEQERELYRSVGKSSIERREGSSRAESHRAEPLRGESPRAESPRDGSPREGSPREGSPREREVRGGRAARPRHEAPRHGRPGKTDVFLDSLFGKQGAQGGSSYYARSFRTPALVGFGVCCAIGLVLLAVACFTSQMMLAVVSAVCFLAAACFGMAVVMLSQGRDLQGLGDALLGGFGRKREGGQSADSGSDARNDGPFTPEDDVPLAASPEESAKQLAAIESARRSLCRECGIGEDGACRRAALLLKRESASREHLQDKLVSQSARAGELRRVLDDARSSFDLEALRERESSLLLRLEKAEREYAVLLIAQRAMDDALDAWEMSSRPMVYARAGELMSLMTDGRWCGLQHDSEIGLCLVDERGLRRAAKELSLGTCQQMYLALRLALLMCAPNVGESLPVIADEVLANFDDARRESAALALAELARHRQVLLLTCHSELVELVRRASPDVNILRL